MAPPPPAKKSLGWLPLRRNAPAVTAPGAPVNRSPAVIEALRTIRYVAVGGLAAILYAVVAVVLGQLTTIGPQLASAFGVTAAALFAYLGHHRLTFAVQGKHGRYLPRFLANVLLGYGVSFLLMRLLVGNNQHVQVGPRRLDTRRMGDRGDL